MTEMLANYIGGEWACGEGAGTPLFDPVTGTELVRVSGDGLDLKRAYDFARHTGQPGLAELSYEGRARALSACVAILKQNRDRYLDISLQNSGTTAADSSIDVDGAIFTLGYYAKVGAALGTGKFMRDGEATSLAKDGSFSTQHIMVPKRGMALLINAFNFPAWGLWEKAAPALLSGLPIVVKPATSTCWLTQQMVHDVVKAGVLPTGAISLFCGRTTGILDPLEPGDVLSFTGSATTAAALRRHPAVADRSVRANIESDSVNSAILLPSEPASSASFGLLIQEAAREITSKSGQKCTAIRRIFVPSSLCSATVEALWASLSSIAVGNPRNPAVRMGSLASLGQRADVERGIEDLRTMAQCAIDGSKVALLDVPSSGSAVMAPWLFVAADGEPPARLHTSEVFGPVATVVGYRDLEHAEQMIAQGEGSLVCSLYGENAAECASVALSLAPRHGRVHAISPKVAKTQTGHGNVMPMSLHGGPGRAGGGEELGGLRGLNFYHQRSAVQGDTDLMATLSNAPLWRY
jgi:3,4-dehydroadipyl-CoA semialdehyde dehydrogenase